MVNLLYYLYLKSKITLFDIEVIFNKNYISNSDFQILSELIKDKQQKDIDMVRNK